MKRIHWSVCAVLAMTMLSVAGAQANILSEVINARANARAGGPTNDHDAWLLDHYGSLSGRPRYSSDYGDSYKKPRKGSRHRRRGYRN